MYFRQAATAFSECGAVAQEYHLTYFRHSARCSNEAGDKPLAAAAHFNGQEYEQAARLCGELSEYDDALWIINLKRDLISKHLIDRIVAHARLHYVKENELQ